MSRYTTPQITWPSLTPTCRQFYEVSLRPPFPKINRYLSSPFRRWSTEPQIIIKMNLKKVIVLCSLNFPAPISAYHCNKLWCIWVNKIWFGGATLVSTVRCFHIHVVLVLLLVIQQEGSSVSLLALWLSRVPWCYGLTAILRQASRPQNNFSLENLPLKQSNSFLIFVKWNFAG